MYDDTKEILKPSIDVQKKVKETIDEKQDEVIKQLKENQKQLKSGLEDIALMNASQELPAPIETTKLPIDYIPKMMSDVDGTPKKKSPYESDLDSGFTQDQIKKLINYKLPPPSQLLESQLDGSIEIDDYDKNIGEKIKNLGREKGTLSKNRKMKEKNKETIEDLTEDIKLLQKYRKRIGIIKEGIKTLGKGIYTQKKRNAYKIS